MLIGIDARMTPDLIYCLAAMGHGDEIAVVDANFPAHSTAAHTAFGETIQLAGLSAAEAVSLISGLMPLDAFVDHCAVRMEVDGKADEMNEVHKDVFTVLEAAKPAEAGLGSIERQDFYSRANRCFAIVQTGERRAYGCFILRKGVVF
ncbi:RbsD/FucU family protein [Consotaella salsifontis]|uniref:L-fucose mutarotase n=1 Tax=Consotaella salsifontis TaxID=1365950 RepID=A0A1T4SMB8_9HYPH|nr:RbsD/FucU domain-containing protein [Consotaella salsifontis]SKA29369.1 L-fucose mutarotase [Consotaella salsifontis]